MCNGTHRAVFHNGFDKVLRSTDYSNIYDTSYDISLGPCIELHSHIGTSVDKMSVSSLAITAK